MNLVFDKELFNPLYWHVKDALENPDIRMILLMGGSSSGKSHSISQALQVDTIENRYNSMMLRKYSVSIDTTIYNDVKAFGESVNSVTKDYEFIQKLIRIKDNHIKFIGLDDSEKIKGISSYIKVYLDELTAFNKSDLDQIKKRLRGRKYQQILASWNPISRNHWVNKELVEVEEWEDMPTNIEGEQYSQLYIDGTPDENSFKKINKDGDTILIKSTYRDNYWVVGHPAGSEFGFYDKHTIANFEKDRLRNPVDYNIYANGNWGVQTERLIFKNWVVVPEIPKEAKRLPTGMDFGFNPDPCSINDLYLHGNDLYIDEVLYEKNLVNISNDVEFSIQEKLETLPSGSFNKEHLIIAESAEPKSITELRIAGFNIRAVKKPRIEDSLRMVKSYNIKITSRSKNVIIEFENYMHKIDKDGEILKEPIDNYNHAIDSIRYVISQKGRLW